MQLRHKSCQRYSVYAFVCVWVCKTMRLRLHDHVIMKHILLCAGQMTDISSIRERSQSFTHVAIKLTRSNVCSVYLCVCVCKCVCKSLCCACVHCANFSNLNRQFQSIATAYRLSTWFLLFYYLRSRRTRHSRAVYKKSSADILDISNTLKVVWIHLPESITNTQTHSYRGREICIKRQTDRHAERQP